MFERTYLLHLVDFLTHALAKNQEAKNRAEKQELNLPAANSALIVKMFNKANEYQNDQKKKMCLEEAYPDFNMQVRSIKECERVCERV